MIPSYTLLNMPLVVMVLAVVVLWAASWIGVALTKGSLEKIERDDFGIILGATLTLLGLIIGFSFSMATSRYDQRKNYEEAEANAIGTEYVRAALLPKADAANVQGLLKAYLDQRLAILHARWTAEHLEQINADTAALQTKLWSAVRAPAQAKPTPVNGARPRRHERRAEFARIHAGGVVESHSGYRVGAHDPHRHRRQRPDRLWFA